MTDSYLTRIPTLPDAALRRYAEQPLDYRTDAVEAALAELARRGLAPAPADLARLRELLHQRDAALRAPGFPGQPLATRLARVHRITAGLLAAGLGSAGVLYLRARPKAPNPLGYEPQDTKRYLRQLEMVGGKANVLAEAFQRWFAGLWEGRNLAFTVGVLTALLAFGYWFVASHQAHAHPDPGEPEG